MKDTSDKHFKASKVLRREEYRSRSELVVRYGVSAQQLNGWVARKRRPFPAPIWVNEGADCAGQPYWHILNVVAWERRERRVKSARSAPLQLIPSAEVGIIAEPRDDGFALAELAALNALAVHIRKSNASKRQVLAPHPVKVPA